VKEHPRAALSAPLALMLLSLPLFVSCRGCDSPTAAAPPVARADAETARPETALPQNFELGRAERGLLEVAGEMDVGNRYASTVMISFTDEMEEPRCSGVLVGSRMVLTAGSCVCAPGKSLQTGTVTQGVIDSSTCEPQAFVTTVVTGAVRDVRWKEDTTEMEFHTYRGSVRPHPRLQLILDDRGTVVSAQADLAAILLDTPIGGEIPEARLAHADAEPGEVLVMAGYAHDDRRGFGGVYGVRYFRKNPVTGAVVDGTGAYRQQGAYLWDGYAGGPCFREANGEQWLVGIAGKGSARELPFTSISFFRAWLEAELLNAAKRDAPSKGAGVKERRDEQR
jgi:hypothetical protein